MSKLHWVVLVFVIALVFLSDTVIATTITIKLPDTRNILYWWAALYDYTAGKWKPEGTIPPMCVNNVVFVFFCASGESRATQVDIDVIGDTFFVIAASSNTVNFPGWLRSSNFTTVSGGIVNFKIPNFVYAINNFVLMYSTGSATDTLPTTNWGWSWSSGGKSGPFDFIRAPSKVPNPAKPSAKTGDQFTLNVKVVNPGVLKGSPNPSAWMSIDVKIKRPDGTVLKETTLTTRPESSNLGPGGTADLSYSFTPDNEGTYKADFVLYANLGGVGTPNHQFQEVGRLSNIEIVDAKAPYHWKEGAGDLSCRADATPPSFTIQYYSDSNLANIISGNNPRLKAGTYYLKITASEGLSGAPRIRIYAEGTANDVTNDATTLVAGNNYKYTRTIAVDAAAVGVTLEDISITGTDSAGNAATNVNPTDEATKAAYTDTTPPTTSISSVAGDTSSPYWDNSNDQKTDVVVSGEANMACRWGTTNVVYSSMSASAANQCSISGIQATCSLGALTQGKYTRYISCKDATGNEQGTDSSQTTGNEDVLFGVDWTAPAEAKVEVPADNAKYTASDMPTVFSGKTKDNIGGSGLAANTVIFYIKRASDNKYWDGDSWETGVKWLGTTHTTTPNAQVTWNSNVNLPSWTGNTYYNVKAKAIDIAGNSFEGAEIIFGYEIDTTPPSTSIVSVAGDTSSPYWDNSNDQKTDVVVSGEANMACRWGTTNVVYSSMSASAANQCSISGIQATCSLGALTQGKYTRYISCKDATGNEQGTDSAQATGNEDVAFGVDWTAPTTASVVTPANNARYAAATIPNVFSGRARDNTGGSGLAANSVVFYIKRESDNQYWTGSVWSNTLTWLRTTHAATTSDTEVTWNDNINLPAWTSNTFYRLKAKATDIAGNTFEGTEISFGYEVCTPSLTILEGQIPFFGTDDGLQAKQGIFPGERHIWNLRVRDDSAFCGGRSFEIRSVTTSGPSCRTGIYRTQNDLRRGINILERDVNNLLNIITPINPYRFAVSSGTTHQFHIFLESIDRTNACTLAFDFINPLGAVVDPSFTVNPGVATPQAPQVSFFYYTGDNNSFDVEWEAFYPNLPRRTMEVKCGLNCDPTASNCDMVSEVGPGKGCIPYPYRHGAEELKEGSCRVSLPAYNFNQENLKCNFYDPSNPALRTIVPTPPTFRSVDFDIRATSRIATTVGQSVQLKVDVANRGIISDSYTIELSADQPQAIDMSPSTARTGSITPGQLASIFFSVRPLVDIPNRITVTVKSDAATDRPTPVVNAFTVKTWVIDVAPGLYALPEFGLGGFLQIIAIAAVVYFLIGNRKK